MPAQGRQLPFATFNFQIKAMSEEQMDKLLDPFLS
jgi:hypothetical protein